MDTRKATSTPEHGASSKYCLRNLTPAKRNLKLSEDSGRKSRKRKRMKNIINNIEKEIEQQLDVQTEENDFITTNVLAIVKEVIRDEDIKEMVRKTLHPGDSSKCYEPKLTRAKVRELLKLRPDLSLPILWTVPTKNTNFVSECLSLINEDYAENSSEDEEYKPDDDDRSEYADSWMPSECADSERGLNDSFELYDASRSIDPDFNESEVEENIGQRTRSKLPLTETPLEVIEQRFLPPDITIDMYETECDNEDWRDFIQGIVQPMDRLNSEHADDPEDDPEYTIQADEEKVDREELRKDKAVEVPFDEVEELISELLRENESFTNKKTNEASITSQQSIAVCTETEHERAENVETPPPVIVPKPKIPVSDCPPLSSSQRLLLEQQLRQHVQLSLTTFLQCHKDPSFFRLGDDMKTNLESLRSLAAFDKKSVFYASNLDDALTLVDEWEKMHADVPKPRIPKIFEKRKKSKRIPKSFKPEFMKVVSKSKAFLYPLLLPKVPFDSKVSQEVYRKEILLSEEWLLVSGLEHFIPHVEKNKKNKDRGTVNVLWESLKLIIHYLLPGFTPSFLQRLIKSRMEEKRENYVKYYFEHKHAPVLKHFVVPVTVKLVCQQPFELLPQVWRDYIEKHFVIVTRKPEVILGS